MALYYDLPVFKDVYKLTLLIYGLTKDFSKEYKYTLGQDLQKDVMVLMRSIYRANKAQKKRPFSNERAFFCALFSRVGSWL
jgi:hypothetical protein